MVRALDRKLLRDLLGIRGQVATVAVVVAAGIATYVTMQSTWRSLQRSMDEYYEAYRFADAFVHLERAPRSIAAHLETIPGVTRVYTRIVDTARISLERESGFEESPVARIVGIPDQGPIPLNAVFLRKGRFPNRTATDEALLLESFAKAHGISVGDRLGVVIRGVQHRLHIVGIALSPEFVLSASEGDITVDDRRFAVIWMRQNAIAPALSMDGAFNDVCFLVSHGASPRAVLDRIDQILAPYGGRGAYQRDHQLSHRALTGELEQLRAMATVVPTIFLAVAAFLVNVVLSRLIQLQRTQIAMLRAVGYLQREIAWHYLKLVSVVVVLGGILGMALGAPLGHGMTRLYSDFFRFPIPRFEVGAEIPFVAITISLGSALVGSYASVRYLGKLTPAEAMQPAPPVTYRKRLTRRSKNRVTSTTTAMIAREVVRFPLRTAISCVGIAMAIAILISGRFMVDAVGYFVDIYFSRSWREDVALSFVDAKPASVLHEIESIEGVLQVEGARVLPVRFRHGHRHRDGLLTGEPPNAKLRRVVDSSGHVVPMPIKGAVLTRKLAEILGVRVGDGLDVELLERDHTHLRIVVAGLADELAGLQAHMPLQELSRSLRDEGLVSVAFVKLDPRSGMRAERWLLDKPAIATMTRRRAVIDNFVRQTGRTMSVITLVLTLFAASIAIGVVYNNARVALSIRYRDFATMRVLGFTRAEVSKILLSELALQTLIAIPIGIVLGQWLAEWMASMTDPEVFRFPTVVSNRTRAIAVLVAIVASAASALIVRRRIDKLDPAEALKTRE